MIRMPDRRESRKTPPPTLQIVSGLVAVAIVAAAAALGYGAVRLSAAWLGISTTASTLGLGGAVLLMLAARTVAGGPVRAAKLRIEHESGRLRAELYLRLLDACAAEVNDRERAAGGRRREELERELAILGDAAVAKTYATLRACCGEDCGGGDPALVLRELLREMRRDLRPQDPLPDEELLAAATAFRRSVVGPPGTSRGGRPSASLELRDGRGAPWLDARTDELP
jgi:hypothetical protein